MTPSTSLKPIPNNTQHKDSKVADEPLHSSRDVPILTPAVISNHQSSTIPSSTSNKEAVRIRNPIQTQTVQDDEVKAAVKIQSIFRGHSTRKMVVNKRAEHTKPDPPPKLNYQPPAEDQPIVLQTSLDDSIAAPVEPVENNISQPVKLNTEPEEQPIVLQTTMNDSTAPPVSAENANSESNNVTTSSEPAKPSFGFAKFGVSNQQQHAKSKRPWENK